MALIHTTYQLRGYLSRAGYAQLDKVLLECARLYNAGLQEWRDAYSVHIGVDRFWGDRKQDWVYVERREKRPTPGNSTYYAQLKEFTGVRADDDFWNSLDVRIWRGTLQRLERAKNAFFRRVKAGEAPGYPRFKSGRRWRTLEMAEVRPNMVRGSRVKIKGLLPIAIPSKRELPPSEQLKTLRITRVGRRVMVSLGYEVERKPLPYSLEAVGIDMRITDRMVLSSGKVIPAGRPAVAGVDIPAAELDSAEIPMSGVDSTEGAAPDVAESTGSAKKELRGSAAAPDVAESTRRQIDLQGLAAKQRRLARTKKGSREFRKRAKILANAHSRQAISNRNECHRITTGIIQRFGHIGVEALKIRNMSKSAKGTLENPGKNVAAKSGLNREILTQTWGLIRQQLAYKAEWAGRRFVEVDPKNTSRMCSQCGVIDQASRDGKLFQCVACGHEADADRNAAVNILRSSLAGGNPPPSALESA